MKQLENTKLYVAGKSKEAQLKAFELGFKWLGRKTEVGYTDKPYLYFDARGFISNGVDIDYFYKHEFREITNDELLNMKKEVEFKPFESKVLARDGSDSWWLAQIFVAFDGNKPFPYFVVGGLFRHCIPYEGNEHLLGTSNSPTDG